MGILISIHLDFAEFLHFESINILDSRDRSSKFGKKHSVERFTIIEMDQIVTLLHTILKNIPRILMPFCQVF